MIEKALIGIILTLCIGMGAGLFLSMGQINQQQATIHELRNILDENQEQISSLVQKAEAGMRARRQLESDLMQSVEQRSVVAALSSHPSNNGHRLTPSQATGHSVSMIAPEQKIEQQLHSMGISDAEIDSILTETRRYLEYKQMESWALRRQAYLQNPEGVSIEVVNPLRARLGDDLYEKYLAAKGRQTGVRVSGIIEQSNADLAGLLNGDRITRYNGQRVFHLHELLSLSAQYDSGDYVEVEVIRNDQPVYLTMNGGPPVVTLPN